MAGVVRRSSASAQVMTAQHRPGQRPRRRTPSLAVENERSRFARDLHDILGHSLTVITVKAELAQRLLDVDPDRARAEIADLERLSRDALADVRRAVEGYRDLTLPGELARARVALARRRDRRRPAELHRRRAVRAARAVRLDGARGRHQRDPAQRRPALRSVRLDRRPAPRSRDDGTRPRRRQRRTGSRAGRAARAGRRRRRAPWSPGARRARGFVAAGWSVAMTA